jgi:hypothetical protein
MGCILFPADDANSSNVVVKMFGRRLFVVDLNTRISSIIWVRDRVSRGRKRIEFVVVKKSDLLNDDAGVVKDSRVVSSPAVPSAQSSSALSVPPGGIKSSDSATTKRAQTGPAGGRLKDFSGFVKNTIANLNKAIANNGTTSKNANNSNGNATSSKTSGSAKAAPVKSQPPPPKGANTLPSRPPLPSIAEFNPLQRDERGYDVAQLQTKPFSVRIVCIDNFISSLLNSVFVEKSIDVNLNDESTKISFFVEVELYYGVRLFTVNHFDSKYEYTLTRCLYREPCLGRQCGRSLV